MSKEGNRRGQEEDEREACVCVCMCGEVFLISCFSTMNQYLSHKWKQTKYFILKTQQVSLSIYFLLHKYTKVNREANKLQPLIRWQAETKQRRDSGRKVFECCLVLVKHCLFIWNKSKSLKLNTSVCLVWLSKANQLAFKPLPGNSLGTNIDKQSEKQWRSDGELDLKPHWQKTTLAQEADMWMRPKAKGINEYPKKGLKTYSCIAPPIGN